MDKFPNSACVEKGDGGRSAWKVIKKRYQLIRSIAAVGRDIYKVIDIQISRMIDRKGITIIEVGSLSRYLTPASLRHVSIV
jgi:hypothetical protein